MTDELARNAQLPRVIVALKPVAPRGQRAQSGLSPRGGTDVHDGRISAAQYGGEIDDSPSQPLAEPRRALVAPIINPLRLGPFVRGARKYDWLAFTIAQFVRHA